ncbi:MAG TPA: hypothetical protein DCL46_05365, partial [Alcanivorax sp.]|nr:hypothetical protein [Alcanivorax sp.]
MTHRAFHRQQGLSLWPLLIVLIVLAALAAAGWWGWQQWRVLEQDRRASQGEISDLRSELNRESQRRDRALQEIRESQDRIEAARARDREALADVRQGGQRLWLINEAESLAALAGQRLMLTGDAEAARRLLQAADQTLARLDDPQALPARKALAVDIEKLNGARQVDVEAMVLRLGALQALIPELAVPERQAPPAEDTEQDAGWWQRLLNHLPVTVRRHEGEVPLPL